MYWMVMLAIGIATFALLWGALEAVDQLSGGGK
jgi:hypothetical protein